MVANPMLGMLNRSQAMQSLTPIKNVMKLLQSSGNPQMVFNQAMSQYPQLREVMDYVHANGGNAKQAFYKMADEKGVNPNEILGLLK